MNTQDRDIECLLLGVWRKIRNNIKKTFLSNSFIQFSLVFYEKSCTTSGHDKYLERNSYRPRSARLIFRLVFRNETKWRRMRSSKKLKLMLFTYIWTGFWCWMKCLEKCEIKMLWREASTGASRWNIFFFIFFYNYYASREVRTWIFYLMTRYAEFLFTLLSNKIFAALIRCLPILVSINSETNASTRCLKLGRGERKWFQLVFN